MARELIEIMYDDIDGTPITSAEDGRSVTFGIDRINYAMELSAPNAEELEKQLEPFIHVARIVKSPTQVRQVRRSRKTLDKIRTWAREAGYNISVYGRVPLAVEEAYYKEH